jgi:hypothetical protein
MAQGNWRVWIERDRDQVGAHMDGVLHSTDSRPRPPGGRTTSWTGLPDGSSIVEEYDGYQHPAG